MLTGLNMEEGGGGGGGGGGGLYDVTTQSAEGWSGRWCL